MTAAPPSLLAQLAAALASRRIRVVDLTQTLSPAFPQIALPPEIGQCWPFRIEEVSAYDARGPGWYWNNFSCGEHTGTHFDAPIHWISGKDLANNSVDTIPADHFVAPACVIDCSEQVKGDADYLMTRRRHRALRVGARPHRRRVVGADAHRLVEARRRRRGVPELRRGGPAHAGAVGRGGALPRRAARRARLRLGGDRHRRRPGRSPAAAVPVPLLHARRRPLRPAVPRPTSTCCRRPARS